MQALLTLLTQNNRASGGKELATARSVAWIRTVTRIQRKPQGYPRRTSSAAIRSMILGQRNVKSRTASVLLRHLGRAGRTLPYDVRGRGRFASKLTSLLLKSGAEPIVHCDMAAGHRLRLDCRVPGHCWTFFSGKYDDEKRSAYCSRSCVLAGSHWMSEPISDFTRFRWQSVQKKSDRAWSPWSPSRATHNGFVTNLALNGCADIAEVLEVALGNECGQVEIALADDFLAGGLVGKATFGSRELYIPVSQSYGSARDA